MAHARKRGRPGGNRKEPNAVKLAAEREDADDHAPTPEKRAAVAAMAATFISHELMAVQLGISARSLRRHYRIEIDTAMERATATVVSRLHEQTKKHPVAAFFWLTNRDPTRWKNASKVEVTGLNGLADRLKRAKERKSGGTGNGG